jgi:hypothetical protein
MLASITIVEENRTGAEALTPCATPVASEQRYVLRGIPTAKAAIRVHAKRLCTTCAQLTFLKGWQVSASASEGAVESIQSRVPDLLIFCQTILDETAEELIGLARELNPNVLAFAICRRGETRNLNAEQYEVRLDDPGRLQTFVARLLQSSTSKRNVTSSSLQNLQTSSQASSRKPRLMSSSRSTSTADEENPCA